MKWATGCIKLAIWQGPCPWPIRGIPTRAEVNSLSMWEVREEKQYTCQGQTSPNTFIAAMPYLTLHLLPRPVVLSRTIHTHTSLP